MDCDLCGILISDPFNSCFFIYINDNTIQLCPDCFHHINRYKKWDGKFK